MFIKKIKFLIFSCIFILASNSIKAENILPKNKPKTQTSLNTTKKIILPKKKPASSAFKKSALKKQGMILPKHKPEIDIKTTNLIKKRRFILPKNKPVTREEKKIVVVDEIKDEKKIVEKTEKDLFILPKKKPVIYKTTKSKIAEKSKYFSKRDFKLAKKIFKSIEKNKWQTAVKLSNKAKDKSLNKLVNWLYLLRESNQASFYEYFVFINKNPNFPRIGRLKYLAEHKINLKDISAKKLVKWFNEESPLSGYGKIKLGEAYIELNNYSEGEKLIKEGFINAKLSKNNLKHIRKKHKKILKSSDYIKRADWLSWENKYWDLKRMLRYLPKDYQALYTARQLLMSKSYGVDNAIAKVPKNMLRDSGLQYNRLKWRRKRGRLESSLEILLEIKNDPKFLVRPDKWWIERAIISRSLIYKKKYELAYKIASKHSLTEGPEYAEAEWMSGWIALSFLNDSIIATKHFNNFYENVGYPISLSRGAYWLGRSYEKSNNKKKSEDWYKEASKYLNTYYGQLAFIKLNPENEFILEEQKEIDKKQKKDFYENELVKLIFLLKELDKTKYTKHLLKHLALLDIENGTEILAGNLAIEIGRYDFAIQIAKKASYEKRFHNNVNYPIINTPLEVNYKKMPSKELVLAVIRQESEFDSKANSSAGAKGMMQLMTYTAKVVSKQAKLSYSKSKLTSDPSYNIKLGSYYLATLLEEYEGSFPFAVAAYNAGPKRVRYWKKINGNPQKNEINYVDWIELIKFKETRNYVQRVLENVNVYKYMLNKKPIKIKNYFYDKPHY